MPATRHDCAARTTAGSGYHHTSGEGAPKRKTCAGCGGRLYTLTGDWSVQVWTGRGNYSHESALSLHRTEKAAERAVNLLPPEQGGPGGYVVRWLSGSS